MDYFSVLKNRFESNKNNMSVNEIVDNFFLDTSNEIGKSIKTSVPFKLKEPVFHCPSYIKLY